VKTKDCGPILIRLSWHDAGVFSDGDLKGGCPNAVMRFTDAGDFGYRKNCFTKGRNTEKVAHNDGFVIYFLVILYKGTFKQQTDIFFCQVKNAFSRVPNVNCGRFLFFRCWGEFSWKVIQTEEFFDSVCLQGSY